MCKFKGFEALYMCAGVYVLFRHRCVFVNVCVFILRVCYECV